MATQAERSTATRGRLLDAAIAVLLERGHAGASLPAICERAGVSRGAQLHHFPTRAALLAAAVEHLFEVRHGEFRARVPGAPTDALTELWRIYTAGPLYAWLELMVAARTDPDLQRHVAAVDARFETAAAETLTAAFPLPPGVDPRVVVRLITSLLDGLATKRIAHDDDRPAHEVLTLAGAILAPLLERR